MCIGRIDLHSCGCFDEVKVFPCRSPHLDGTPNNCDGIGAMITNHVNHFCGECAERKKMNALRLALIVAESREGKIELFAAMGDGADMVGVAEGVRKSNFEAGVMDRLRFSGGLDDGLTAFLQEGEDDGKKGGVEHGDDKANETSMDEDHGKGHSKQSKPRYSKFSKGFLSCFKGD